MDLCAVSLRGAVDGRGWTSTTRLLRERVYGGWDRGAVSFGRGAPGHRSIEWRAIRKDKRNKSGVSSSSGSNDHSVPDGDDDDWDMNQMDLDGAKFDSSCPSDLDWRTFRANLVAREQVSLDHSDEVVAQNASHDASARVGTKWAHPIATPETGCVLVATEKLDGVRNFERTVILLLQLRTMDPQEGPFGVIINRPLHKKIKHMNPTNADLATTFSDCSLQFGGPLDASMFLMRSDDSSPPLSFEQVVPGICYGTRNSLDEAAGLVKKGIFRPRDFRFFVGYAGWQLDQLIEEIEAGYWVVAACSSDLISCLPEHAAGLWEEILQLMGGQYSDLSRKPRQDSL